MIPDKHFSRRCFLQATALTAGMFSLSPATLMAADRKARRAGGKSTFTLWQIPSHRDTIGNSYVFRTESGKVVVMDGGYEHEVPFLRGFLGALGNEVEAWFISHPHPDHMEALNEILKAPQDLRIKAVYHSRISEAVMKAEPQCEAQCREFYARLAEQKDIKVVDVQQPGLVLDFDGMQVKVLGVANEFVTNPYNNSSMVMRVWDKSKSILFLGDAGVECGQKLLDGPFADHLDSDYVQMAHHGQNGCDENFYRAVKFRACLWSTPTWVWNNDQGKGFNTGILATVKTRNWMDSLGIKEHHVSCLEGLCRID